ncbi:MAG: HtaA domain-containing protein [Solirubrobacterales bacterium]
MKDVTQPLKGRGTMLSVVATVAVLVGLLAFAPLASAASDPLSSGTTRITLNKGFFKKLKKNGVKVLKVSPGTVKSRTVTLPVSGGSLDPITGLGTIEHSGGVKFKRGKKTAPVNTLVLDTTTKSLKAKVAGKSMKFASVAGYTVARNGFGANVSITKLKLTGKAAKQLNKKLGFTGKKKSGKKKARPLFKGNQVLGSSTSETQPKTVTVLPSGKASLLTNEATVKKFVLPPPNGLAVKIEPISPTEVETIANPFTPILKFPISGGSIAPDASSGKVETTGGVRLVQKLVAGTTTITLGNILVDLSAKTATAEITIESTISPELNKGALGRSSIADLNLSGATIKSDPSAHTVTVENAAATLQEVTALVLTEVFGAPFDAVKVEHAKFAKGDPLGTFSFTAQTQ